MQLHKRLTIDQVKTVIKGYVEGALAGPEALEALAVKRTVFFELVRRYRQEGAAFAIAYQRRSPKKIPAAAENKIQRALRDDQRLIQNPDLPVWTYNYSAIRDRLRKDGLTVSVPTIITRAKQVGCYEARKPRKPHDREVITTAIGTLIQHDASLHLWSPFATEKWTLITSIEDFSRRLLYGEFVEAESTWAHIVAVRDVMVRYGIPLNYYVDSLRVFRFVDHGASVWRESHLATDEVNPQWKQCVTTAGAKVIYALSPQAKGKVERPYRWLQDRIVRTCALEKLSRLEDVRQVLRHELTRYNEQQVHSTTKEIPMRRFERALQTGQSLFRPFVLPAPFTHRDDVFCLRETRQTNSYRRISLWNQDITVPKVNPLETVEIHIIPDLPHRAIGLRLWHAKRLVLTTTYPASAFPKVRF
jgi:hypothetical protein